MGNIFNLECGTLNTLTPEEEEDGGEEGALASGAAADTASWAIMLMLLPSKSRDMSKTGPKVRENTCPSLWGWAFRGQVFL